MDVPPEGRPAEAEAAAEARWPRSAVCPKIGTRTYQEPVGHVLAGSHQKARPLSRVQVQLQRPQKSHGVGWCGALSRNIREWNVDVTGAAVLTSHPERDCWF